MSQFIEVIPLVVQTVLTSFIQPLYWVVVLIIAYQYHRLARMKENLFGVRVEPAWRPILRRSFTGRPGGWSAPF